MPTRTPAVPGSPAPAGLVTRGLRPQSSREFSAKRYRRDWSTSATSRPTTWGLQKTAWP